MACDREGECSSLEELRIMDTSSIEDWVEQYLEWTQPDVWTGGWSGAGGISALGDMEAAGAAAGSDFVTELLDWMDLAATMRAAGAAYRAAGGAGGSRGDMAGVDVFRDALLAALRTESDCLGLLQRVLDAGDAPPRMARLASRALRHAERLLVDERIALRYLQRYEWPQARLESDPAPEADWPHAIDKMAADVSALKGAVLAARHH
jgi:hypothetical protein